MSKITTLGRVLGLFLLAAGQAEAQTDYSKVEMKTTDLGHRTYMLEGAGGNITVAVGDDGIMMVDGQFAPLHDKIKSAIETCRRSRSAISSTRTSMATIRAATRALPRMAPL